MRNYSKEHFLLLYLFCHVVSANIFFSNIFGGHLVYPTSPPTYIYHLKRSIDSKLMTQYLHFWNSRAGNDKAVKNKTNSF